jgi:hypothetical protein
MNFCRVLQTVYGRSRFAKLSFDDDLKVKIAPVYPDSMCDL